MTSPEGESTAASNDSKSSGDNARIEAKTFSTASVCLASAISSTCSRISCLSCFTVIFINNIPFSLKRFVSFKYYLLAAEQNHPGGMRGVGEMYECGTKEIEANLESAAEYYHKAADLGDFVAEYNLGVFYQYGTGVMADQEKANQFLERASSKGHCSAMLNLGLLHQEGIPNLEEEMQYFVVIL
ncbi:sel1 repeat family protein [bacterium]|nr:sel1 repeat family protein [Candidatus Elulimicrobium humile]